MTRGIPASWYVSFQPLVAALTASIGVFTAVHFISDFRVIPALIAPLVMLMQGTKLTMGVIELLTGHLVAGTSRVASGIMQLVLLGFGIVAGAQLVGVEAVSYTHLTLPTSDLVEISVVAEALTKKKKKHNTKNECYKYK